MKKLLLCAFSVLSVLSASSTSAIIHTRQIWERKDGKTVEVLSDIHVEEVLLGDHFSDSEKELLLSNELDIVAAQQQKDILWNASLYDSNVHVWIEDMASFMIKNVCEASGKVSPEMVASILDAAIKSDEFKKLPTVLGLLSELCKQAKIPCTNIEFRCKDASYAETEKEVAGYNDGAALDAYYKRLKRVAAPSSEDNANDFLFNARLVHRVAHCIAPHQIIVVGGNHEQALVEALPLIGYRLRMGGMYRHPELQNIIDAPENELELSMKKYVTKSFWQLAGEDAKLKAESTVIRPGMDAWVGLFKAMHPIDIRALVEQERKEAGAKMIVTASGGPLRAAPAIPAPILAPAYAGVPSATLRARL